METELKRGQNEQPGSSYLLRCEQCRGEGWVGKARCVSCAGRGVVLAVPGKALNWQYFFWQAKYSYARIIQGRQQKKVRVLINGLFFIFGIIGLLALVKVIYDWEILKHGALNLRGWLYFQDDYLLLWWLSVLGDMYLIYRINRESNQIKRIKKIDKLKDDLGRLGQIELREGPWPLDKRVKGVEISQFFNARAIKLIEEAWLLAFKAKHRQVQNIHLLAVMFEDSDIKMVFGRLGLNYAQMAERIKSALSKINQSGQPIISAELKESFLVAYAQAEATNKDSVGPTDLLYALAHNEGIVKEILYELEITDREINNVIAWVDLQRWLIKKWHEFKYLARLKPKHAMNRTYTAVATPNLDAVSRDMTLWARGGAYLPCINRKKEISNIFKILEIEKLGAVLVGQPGVGKRTMIEGIAQLMVSEEVPEELQDKRLVELSVSALVAGAAESGEIEKRVLTVMNEIGKAGNVVLFIEDIHHMVGVNTGGGKSLDVAEVLAEAMQANNFYVLATTTPEFYKQYIEQSSLSKVMQKIVVNEPEEDEAIRILESKALFLEGQEKIYFSYQSIESAVSLSKQYLHDEYLPEKAIKVIEQTALTVKQKRGERSVVKAEDVAEVIAELTNIPVTKISEDESKKLLNLEEKMHERIVGQEEAVRLVAMALRRARTELRGANRPIASFLFLGPTGVGKTEVAKTLARVYFGSQENMIRVDMSEYQAADALSKLIGDARSKRGGYLTEAVRKNPFSLILLDEVEKAKLDILNVFLQVLDDGRLTDATGRTVDFTNTIIIGTSNAGTEFIQQSLKEGKSLESIRDELINTQLKNYFRPELLNRFDGIVVFKPLELGQVEEITRIFLNELAARLEEKGVELEAEEAAVKELAKLGFDPTLGARPLRRVIQDRVEDELAKLFLEHKVDRRDKIILRAGLKLEVKKAEKI